jgi:hypothetical protein
MCPYGQKLSILKKNKIGVDKMLLRHYSHSPVHFADLEDRFQSKDGGERGGVYKPDGLWVSPVTEDGWAAWCRAESYSLGGFVYDVEIDLKRILLIDTVYGIDKFSEQYGFDIFPGNNRVGSRLIDWIKVSKKYDGIIIIPYQYSRRLERYATWYYGWDCASGCIWKTRAIKSFVPRLYGACERFDGISSDFSDGGRYD